MTIRMLSIPRSGGINISTVMRPILGSARLSWQLLTKYNFTPRIDINVHTVGSLRLENSWLLVTQTQLSNIAQISWAHIMIFGHGRMYIHSTDTHHPKMIYYDLLYFIFWQRRSKGRYSSLHWTTIQILDGALLSSSSLTCLSPSLEGDCKMCCLWALYFKSFIIKRFKCTQIQICVIWITHLSSAEKPSATTTAIPGAVWSRAAES